MSSSHTTSGETMFVKKLGDYFGATVYALYPNQSMLAGSLGVELRSYVSNLASWLAKGILSSQSLSKTLISAKPLLSPEIRCGLDQRSLTSSLPARILDDFAICEARAYYTAHREQYKPRKIYDMAESDKRGRIFISNYLFPAIRQAIASTSSALNTVLKLEDCSGRDKQYSLSYEGFDKPIVCKPDAIVYMLIKANRVHSLRALVVEVADTDTQTVLGRKHVLPRIHLYTSAVYLCTGVVTAGVYVSLSPASDPPALLVTPALKTGRVLAKLLNKLKAAISANAPPKPSGKPPCTHCVYASTCIFRGEYTG